MSPSMQRGQQGVAVLVAPRRTPRPARGAPPPRNPGSGGGGGDPGGGGGGGPPAAGGEGVGPFALALALAGITTLFAVLIAVWIFLRRPAPDWDAAGALGALDALWLSTACLAASSGAVELAARRARAGGEGRRSTLRWLAASVVLGAGFLAAQARLWSDLWHSGLVPASSGYAAVFYALTGLHALHVLGGLGFLGALTLALHRARAGAASVRLGAVYWHYMGALWGVLFTLLYFVR